MAEGKKRNGELLGSHSRRFALLYNVEGFKYTIGQCFESREQQGEYLFCYGKGVEKKTSHCEITCGSGGQFWVKDSQGLTGNGTFINGERIHDRVEFKFGDVLALGDPNENEFTSFLFAALEEPETVQSEELVATEGGSKSSDLEGNCFVETPLTNSLVLATIFGYLRFSDMKKCRLVCSLWNEEATKLLKSNSAIRFSYHDIHSNFSSVVKPSRLFSFVQEMGGFFNEGSFHVTLPSCLLPNCVCKGCRDSLNSWGSKFDRRSNSECKLVSDLKWFFHGGFPHPITKLDLTGTLRHKPGRQLFYSVLKGCSTHLEDLTLSMRFSLKPAAKKIVPFGMNFPSLKKLEINLERIGYTYDTANGDFNSSAEEDDYGSRNWKPYKKILGKWNTSMITSASGLQSLKLTNWTEGRYQNFGDIFLGRIIKLKGFPNLNSLELMSYNCDILKSILLLPKLKSLSLGVASLDIDYDDDDDEGRYDEDEPFPLWTVLMSNVLNKSAETLKYLDLTLPELRARNRDRISLPVFSNLTVFRLEEFYPNVFAVSDGGFGFKTHFPSLKDCYFDWIKEKDFFDVFFPHVGSGDDDGNNGGYNAHEVNGLTGEDKEPETSSSLWNHQMGRANRVEKEEVVKSVRVLKIYIKDWSPAGVDKMDQLFPNAFNTHLETVRAKELKELARLRWNFSK